MSTVTSMKKMAFSPLSVPTPGAANTPTDSSVSTGTEHEAARVRQVTLFFDN